MIPMKVRVRMPKTGIHDMDQQCQLLSVHGIYDIAVPIIKSQETRA